jgi:hypothetical protein
MTTDALKMIKPSCLANLKYVGLTTAGIPAKRITGIHGSVVSTEQVGGNRITDNVELAITKGGLRTKESPPDAKKLFKSEIVPVLVEHLQGFDQQYTGKLVLNFHHGELTNFSLAPQRVKSSSTHPRESLALTSGA